MSINWTSSAGQPSDSVGAVGDLNWDTINRITWGPKAANNSWASTAYSNIGPTGPAMLSGIGAPGSSLGQPGNGYTDVATGNTYLKSGSSWSQTGNIIGPAGLQGSAGYTALTTQSAGVGPSPFITGVTMTSTATVLPIAGAASVPLLYSPLQSSALIGIGGSFIGSTACTLALYDVTASTTIWSGALPTATGPISFGFFTATQYPLVANHAYQWQVTGSGSPSIQIHPYYLQPSATSATNQSFVTGFTSAASTTFSATALYIGPGARNGTSGSCKNYQPVRAGSLNSATATFYPSVQGAATTTATFTLLYYTNVGGAGGTLATFSATNNGVPQTTTFASNPALTTANVYYIYVTGSGTGLVDVQLNVTV